MKAELPTESLLVYGPAVAMLVSVLMLATVAIWRRYVALVDKMAEHAEIRAKNDTAQQAILTRIATDVEKLREEMRAR